MANLAISSPAFRHGAKSTHWASRGQPKPKPEPSAYVAQTVNETEGASRQYGPVDSATANTTSPTHLLLSYRIMHLARLKIPA